MISQRVETMGRVHLTHHVLRACSICGSPAAEWVPEGSPSYCRRHAFTFARIMELIGSQDHTKLETQQFLAQAEEEADRIFGGISR